MRRNNIIKPTGRWINRGNYSSIRGVKSASHLQFNLPNQEMRGDRKRKFSNPRSHMQDIMPNVCSEQPKSVQDPRSDGAKTSEFAYFKKLKKVAAQSELYPRDREKSQSTEVELNQYEREKTMKLKQRYDEPKSSVKIRTERSSDQPCLTPLVHVSKSSEEIINMVETCEKDMNFPSSNNSHCSLIPQSYPNYTGVQHWNKGIFGLKRRKLRQWVSGTLHQEIGELSSEGFSLVSMLLNRLFPEENKENCDWEEPKYSQAEISTQDQLPSFPDDNTQSRGHYGTRNNHLMESEDAAYEDYNFTKYWSKHSRDVVLPDLENVSAEYISTTYPIKAYPPCKDMKLYHKIDASITENLFPESRRARYQLPLFPYENTHYRGHYRTHTNFLADSENAGYQDYCFTRYPSEHQSDVIFSELDNAHADFPSTTYPIKTYLPCTYVKPNLNKDASFTGNLVPESNPCFQLQSENFGSIGLEDHLENFDICHDPNGSLLEGEPHALLLGWDYSNDKDKHGLSISSCNRNMNLLAHSGDNDHWQSHDRRDGSALSSSSLVSSYFFNCTSLTRPNSANFCSACNSGRYSRYDNYLYAKLDHFPAPFSCNPDSLRYLCGPSDDFSSNNQLETRNTVLSDQDHFWNLNKVICEDNFHDQDSLFESTSLDKELREKHLWVSDYSTENQLSMVPAYQNAQLVGPAACFLGEEDKECLLYNSRCTSDYSDSLDFQDFSALNIQRSRDNGVSIQRHSTSWGFPILERYHKEADDDTECEFE